MKSTVDTRDKMLIRNLLQRCGPCRPRLRRLRRRRRRRRRRRHRRRRGRRRIRRSLHHCKCVEDVDGNFDKIITQRADDHFRTTTSLRASLTPDDLAD